MKRVIEIDEDRYDVLQKLEKATHGTGYMNYFEETIANSTPLNEVLDIIINEINTRRKYMSFTTCQDCVDIIEAYKESEDEE